MNIAIRRVLRVLLVALPAVVTGCARTSTVPLDEDTIEVTVHVATICDGRDAERLARRHAAVETIRRGFDDYVVIDSVGGDHVAEEHARDRAHDPVRNGSPRTLFSEDAPLDRAPSGADGADVPRRRRATARRRCPPAPFWATTGRRS